MRDLTCGDLVCGDLVCGGLMRGRSRATRTHISVPNEPHALVLYLPALDEWTAALERLHAFGATPSKAENPYWDRQGKTFEDPDGYRIVRQHAAWG